MSLIDHAPTILDGTSSLLLNFLQRVDPEQAKGEFFFFFFGGSGALGIGAAQVPKIAAELDGMSSLYACHILHQKILFFWCVKLSFLWFLILEIKKLGGSPITEGGEDLDCNFIATIGYPEPLKVQDVQKIIDNAPYVEKILAAGNKKSYMAQIGYLERQGFNDCFVGDDTDDDVYTWRGGFHRCNSIDIENVLLFFPLLFPHIYLITSENEQPIEP